MRNRRQRIRPSFVVLALALLFVLPTCSAFLTTTDRAPTRHRRRRCISKSPSSLEAASKSSSPDNNKSNKTTSSSTRRRKKTTTSKSKSKTASSSSSSQWEQRKQQQQQQEEPIQTIGGGPAMIFEMARRMSLWNDVITPGEEERIVSSQSSTPRRALPRWRPMPGVSDDNPNFRTKAPTMNNQGYASSIWRNVRKYNKPSLWRYALRTYQRMKLVEEEGEPESSGLQIRRYNVHFEGALLACAKLGLWQEALEIYRDVEDRATTNQTALVEREQDVAARRSGGVSTANQICVTEHMILSVISACVRGSRRIVKDETASLEERRAPLDAVVELLKIIEKKHGIPLEARHLNPVAAAYQSLGLMSNASQLLQKHLKGRKSRPESENGDDPFNVNDVGAKDKASYALLVKGAVSTGDWADAVNALKDMTEAGLYPKERHLNAWTEVSERQTRQRTTRSWKKKRDEYWLESLR